MGKFSSEMDDRGIRETTDGLRRMAFVAAQSVNATARQARDQSITQITDHLNLRRPYVQGKFSIRTASPTTLTAFVNAVDTPVQIRQYDARQEFTSAGKKAGVSVQILRAGSRKTLRSAFFGPLRSGAGIGVFGRKTQARYPLRVLYAPSPAQMFKTITPEMSEPLLKSLIEDLMRRTDGVFGAAGNLEVRR